MIKQIVVLNNNHAYLCNCIEALHYVELKHVRILGTMNPLEWSRPASKEVLKTYKGEAVLDMKVTWQQICYIIDTEVDGDH